MVDNRLIKNERKITSSSGTEDSDIPKGLQTKSIISISTILPSIFSVVVIFTIFDILQPSSNDEDVVELAKIFFSTNIEILVTIFAVTLGVTLLGLQFRAQSYTMLALVRYIRDKTVYGFVTIFVGLISMNMFFMIRVGYVEDAILQIILYGMSAGTVFSLCYLVWYIYYMVEKIQPGHILKYIEQDIQNIPVDSILKNDKRSREFEAFQMWEQVTIRAATDDNEYVFSRGMELIFEKRDEYIKSLNDEVKKHKINDFFLEYIQPVMFSCVKLDRVRFVRIFLVRSEKIAESSIAESGDYDRANLKFVQMWNKMMREAIIYNNDQILEECIKYLKISMDANIQHCANNDKKISIVVDFFYTQISSLVGFAVSKNHHVFFRRYLDFLFYEFDRVLEKESLYRDSMLHWETIMIHTVTTHNHKIFELGMIRMLYFMSRMSDQDVSDKRRVIEVFNFTLLRLSKKICIEKDHRYIMTFFKKYPSWVKKKDQPVSSWLYVMLDLIQNKDVAIFIEGMQHMNKYSMERKNLGSFENFYPVKNQYLKGSYTGAVISDNSVKTGIFDDEFDSFMNEFVKDFTRYAMGYTDDYEELCSTFTNFIKSSFENLDDVFNPYATNGENNSSKMT